jgi:hypothetical protein
VRADDDGWRLRGHLTTRREQTMQRYKRLLERYVERYNAGDLDGVMDL